MFSKKEKNANSRFQDNYCKGFNVGVSLVKHIAPPMREQAKEILHLMILEKPKDIAFHAILTGFSYEIQQEIRLKQELTLKRMREVADIENGKDQNIELERGS